MLVVPKAASTWRSFRCCCCSARPTSSASSTARPRRRAPALRPGDGLSAGARERLVAGSAMVLVDRRAARTGDLEVQMIHDSSRGRAEGSAAPRAVCAGLAVALLAACSEARRRRSRGDCRGHDLRARRHAARGLPRAEGADPIRRRPARLLLRHGGDARDRSCGRNSRSASSRSSHRTWRKADWKSRRGHWIDARTAFYVRRQQPARLDGPDARVVRQRGGRAGVRRQVRRQGAALRSDHASTWFRSTAA